MDKFIGELALTAAVGCQIVWTKTLYLPLSCYLVLKRFQAIDTGIFFTYYTIQSTQDKYIAF